jgi:hypothetical protein
MHTGRDDFPQLHTQGGLVLAGIGICIPEFRPDHRFLDGLFPAFLQLFESLHPTDSILMQLLFLFGENYFLPEV